MSDPSSGPSGTTDASSELDRFQMLFDRVPRPGELERYLSTRYAMQVGVARRIRPRVARLIVRV